MGFLLYTDYTADEELGALNHYSRRPGAGRRQTARQRAPAPERPAALAAECGSAAGMALPAGAQLVWTSLVRAAAEAVGQAMAPQGAVCVFGDPGRGKTVTVRMALSEVPAGWTVTWVPVPVRPAVAGNSGGDLLGIRPGGGHKRDRLPVGTSALTRQVAVGAGTAGCRGAADPIDFEDPPWHRLSLNSPIDSHTQPLQCVGNMLNSQHRGKLGERL